MGSQVSDQWVVLVEQSLAEPAESDGVHVIFPRVPKSLKNKGTEIFYTPLVISFGPYHFQKKDPLLDEIEGLKSEVARKYNNRLNGGLHTVVQNFMSDDTQKRIRKIYGQEFPRNICRDVLSWMAVRDGCFLIEILNRFSNVQNEENNRGGIVDCRTTDMDVESMLPSTDRILGRKRYHPLLNAIVKDIFKMENQLPLWVLEEIDRGWPPRRLLVESALRNLSPIEVTIEEKYSNYNKKHHILHLLHDYIVDKPRLNRVSNFQLTSGNFQMRHPKWISLPLNITDCRPSVLSIMNVIWRIVVYAFIFIVRSPVLILHFAWFIMCLIWGLYQGYISDTAAGMEETHIPTLVELQRLGVKFKRLEGRGIFHIRFEESNSTLHLPKFKVDDRSEVLLRNLMALEIFSGDVGKPITRYALLMNDLVNTSADVAILRKHNIITSKLGSDEDVAKLWNSVMVATEMPTYVPIDEAASGINCYCKKNWKVLWAQFKMVHCSKPWLVLSLLGGTSLLMLTGVQVACLFRNYQI